MLSMLGVSTERFYRGGIVTPELALADQHLAGVLLSARCSESHFGHPLLIDIDPDAPRFYSEIDLAPFSIGGRSHVTIDDVVA